MAATTFRAMRTLACRQMVQPLPRLSRSAVPQTQTRSMSVFSKLFGKGKAGEAAAGETKNAASEAASKAKSGAEKAEEPTGAAFQTVTDAGKELFEESILRHAPYKERVKILKGRRRATTQFSQKNIEANETATGIVMHKDSQFATQWKNFKENNPVIQGMFGLKMKYDESDNIAIRWMRELTDKFQELFGGAFNETEMAAALAEIQKLDPQFNPERFVIECELVTIPTVLEAFISGDLETLKEWCSEPLFNMMSAIINQRIADGHIDETNILDLRGVELQAAQVLDQGPVLVLSFSTQQTTVVRNKAGEVIDGSADKVHKVFYVIALCRDRNVLDPQAAWRVMEFGIHSQMETW
eukprot:Colp12_sorted_trinity150504_noHs@3033